MYRSGWYFQLSHSFYFSDLHSKISWHLPISPFSSFVYIFTVPFNFIYSRPFLLTLSWKTAPVDHFWKFIDWPSLFKDCQMLLSLTHFRFRNFASFSLHSQTGLQCFPMNIYWLLGGLSHSHIPHLFC